MSALVDAEHRSRSRERQVSACGNRRLSTQRCDAERGLRGRRVPGYSSGGSEGRTAERRALPVPAQQLAPQEARGTVREPNGSLGASGWLWAARRAGQRRSAPGTAVAPPRPRLMRKHRPGRRRGGVAGMAQRALPLPRQQSFSPPVVPNPFVHPGGPSAGDKLRVRLAARRGAGIRASRRGGLGACRSPRIVGGGTGESRRPRCEDGAPCRV